jgi:hypothetical protein
VWLLFPLTLSLVPFLSASLEFQLHSSFQETLINKSQGIINISTVLYQILWELRTGRHSVCHSHLASSEAGHKYLPIAYVLTQRAVEESELEEMCRRVIHCRAPRCKDKILMAEIQVGQ